VSILGSSVGLTRYRILEEVTDEILRNIPELLKKHAFMDIDATAEERSFGWTNIDNMLDMIWADSPPEKGEYFAFSLRLDTRRIQPAVLKKHYQIALNEELAKAKEQGRDFLSRERKKEIKEQVSLRLRARSLPIPAVFDIIWAPSDNRIYLDTTNAKAKGLFEDLFRDTFELTIEPLTPFFLAMEHLGEDAAQRLETLEPTSFV